MRFFASYGMALFLSRFNNQPILPFSLLAKITFKLLSSQFRTALYRQSFRIIQRMTSFPITDLGLMLLLFFLKKMRLLLRGSGFQWHVSRLRVYQQSSIIPP